MSEDKSVEPRVQMHGKLLHHSHNLDPVEIQLPRNPAELFGAMYVYVPALRQLKTAWLPHRAFKTFAKVFVEVSLCEAVRAQVPLLAA